MVALQEAFAEESDVTVRRTYGSKHHVFGGIGGRAQKPSPLIGLHGRWANYVIDFCSVLGAVVVSLKIGGTLFIVASLHAPHGWRTFN